MLTKSESMGVVCILAALALAGCGRDHAATERQAGRAGQPGGQLTVLLDVGWNGSWPAGLDPATDTTARANLSMMNAIYGGLFQLTADAKGANARVAGVLASGYGFADHGKTLIIHLRKGVTFADGTPFDAAAVRFNIERDLRSACTCAPTDWPWDKTNPVTSSDSHTVELHFSRPYGPAIDALPVSNVNWIASPTALKRMGEDQFRITPVGAGPFRVVSDVLSTKLVLERNPRYWEAGRPHLRRLTFQPISSEEAAYQSVLAGDAQVYEGMTSPRLIDLAEKSSKITVTPQPATSPYVIQLNTLHPPFNDKRAREAIYYATDVRAILRGLFNSQYPPAQSFTAPGGLFYHRDVPGYRSYDLAKARLLVKELGGLHVTLGTLKSVVAEHMIVALQSQWQKAGIAVSIESQELSAQIREFRAGSWQAMLMEVGSYDPEAGLGVSFRFRSTATYTGVRDSALDRILASAAGTIDPQERNALYLRAAKYISDNAYAPFLFAPARAQLAARGVRGPGLTTRIPPISVNTGILWQDVMIDDSGR